jgi:hypothetical protein
MAYILRTPKTLGERAEVATVNCLAPESTFDLSEMSETTHIEAHIQSRLSGRIRGLQVLRKTNGLILRGRTRTYYAKQLAQHAVMAATDLPILANEIEVC